MLSVPSTWIWDDSQDLLGGAVVPNWWDGDSTLCSRTWADWNVCRPVVSFEVRFEQGIRSVVCQTLVGLQFYFSRLDVRVLQALEMSLA